MFFWDTLLFKDVWRFMLTSNGVCWRLMVCNDVFYCLQMLKGCLRNFARGVWVLYMDLFKVWMRIRLYRSGQALYGVANALYWKSSERQISKHLTVLKYQNTKTPYISSLKIIGFLHFLNFLGPPENGYNLQSLMITLFTKNWSVDFDTVNTLFQSLNIEPCLCAGQTRGGSRAQFCWLPSW